MFLARYSAWMLGCGATCIRLEKNIGRIAAAYGLSVETTIMPRHVHLTVIDRADGSVFTSIATVEHTPISFDINTRLSQLSWEIADGRIGFEPALKRLDSLSGADTRNQAAVTLLVALANASFCRLFGGDITAMAIVGIATLCGYWLKLFLLGRGTDVRLTFMLCAFVSAVLGASDSLFALGSTPAIATGTSVLYLIPGIPFLNSFSDMLYRHYICAFSRLMDALVLTCCISFGLCCGMALMHQGMF